jgi:hypothetical protein
MKTAFRVLIAGIAALATYFAVGLLPFLFSVTDSHPQVKWIHGPVAILCALLVGGYTLLSARKGLIGSIAVGALVTGAIGFSAGFFGPILFMPEANQGPLIGLVTGPLGFLLGAVVGGFNWFIRRKRASKSKVDAPPAG